MRWRFIADGLNELWCIDIIEYPAWDGKVYCCAILDGFGSPWKFTRRASL